MTLSTKMICFTNSLCLWAPKTKWPTQTFSSIPIIHVLSTLHSRQVRWQNTSKIHIDHLKKSTIRPVRWPLLRTSRSSETGLFLSISIILSKKMKPLCLNITMTHRGQRSKQANSYSETEIKTCTSRAQIRGIHSQEGDLWALIDRNCCQKSGAGLLIRKLLCRKLGL